MNKCQTALENEMICGKTICCFYCEEREKCTSEEKCTCGSDGCESLIVEAEDTGLQVMQSEVSLALQKVTEITIQKKKLEEQEKLVKQEILKAMEKHGIKSFENESVKFLYVAPTERTSVDSTKLKKKYPEIASECSKTSKVSASVRITVK